MDWVALYAFSLCWMSELSYMQLQYSFDTVHTSELVVKTELKEKCIDGRKLDFCNNWQHVKFWPKYCWTVKAVVISVDGNFTPLQYSTYNIKSWVSIHIEELTVPQLFKLFPTIYKAQRFMTICSTACQFSFCWVRLIKTTPSHPVCLRTIVILPSISYSTNGTV